ncbi:hypothetical protein BD770DRAFT_401786 [Pilaira anomala]|nr:hypothetical protein BD770DRAFT_401786 [Pilaira anomala]
MYNASIHSSIKVSDIIENRNKHNVYIFLNNTQKWIQSSNFELLLGIKLKHNQLMESEALMQRITEACNNVPLSYLANITQRSKNHFENCLTKSQMNFKKCLNRIHSVFQFKFEGCSISSSNFVQI